jgi:CheY-like chemotaxis protein
MNNQKGILLVENDPEDVKLFQYAMRQANLAIPLQVASNGLEAIYYLAGKAPYDDRNLYPLPEIVLTELKLPKLTGLELLQWIKHRPYLQQVSVIIMNRSGSEGEMPAIDWADMRDHFYRANSSSFDSIIAMIKELFDQEYISSTALPSTAAVR